jgi:hypothetical protein
MRTPRKMLLLICLVLVLLSLVKRTTPAQAPSTNTVSSTAAAVLDRVLSANGRQWSTGEITDSIGDGKLTLFGSEGQKATFDFTLLRKGNTQIQRVVKQPAGELRQGSDGLNTWESIPGFYTPKAQGHALQLIESQTSRSIPRLLNYQKEGLTVRDLGTQDETRVIEAEDRQGKKTSYFISTSNFVTKLEFVTGQTKDPFSGTTISDTDTYLFSDYRVVQGLLTPFKIERYNGRNKIEEMQFTTFKYNAGLKDTSFTR